MPDPEKVVEVVSEWVAKADNDLQAARLSLRAGKECPTDTVCFHAQQVIEKYIKALLTARNIPFPKTHSIRKLMQLLPAAERFPLSEDEQDRLTEYATTARYPGWGEISMHECRHAVAVASRVRSEIRRLLPRAALRRRKP